MWVRATQYKWSGVVLPSDFLPISSELTGPSDVSKARIEIWSKVCIVSSVVRILRSPPYSLPTYNNTTEIMIIIK